MSNPDLQDLLIYAGIPLAIIGLVFALVYASSARGAKRYRPGRPYDFAPVWYLARPESDGPGSAASLTAGERKELVASEQAPVVGLTGGASDRW